MIAEVPTLAGDAVVLRPYRDGFDEAELRTLYRWARDEELVALSGGMVLDMPFERFRAHFIDQLPRRNTAREQLFAILDAEHRLVGRIGVFGCDRATRTAELGIVIGERDCWSRGYGRDAVRTLMRFAFDRLTQRRLVLYTLPENERARRAFEAAGFAVTRRLRRFSLARGSHDEIEMVAQRAP